MSAEDTVVRFGPAGWSYADWQGRIYRGRQDLGLVSRVFDTIEINTTFYRPPSPAVVEGWIRKVAHNPAFLFAAKLWKVFTHEAGFRTDEVQVFRSGIQPLVDSERLGALLVQFPWSFMYERSSREHLARVLDAFEGLPLVLELRHRSWNRPRVLAALEARAVTFCNIDQPQFDGSLEPTTIVTSETGYVRLHGRNRSAWFRVDAGRDERYDYCYSSDELRPWSERVRDLAAVCRRVFVITNNHFGGSAVVNALELAHLYDRRSSEVPALWLETFPRLGACCQPQVSVQPLLFSGNLDS